MTNIAVQRTIVTQMEKPYSVCTSKSESVFYKQILSLNYSYSRMDCITLCKQKKIEDNCDCYFSSYFRVAKSRRCTGEADYKCINEQLESFVLNELSPECNELCPVECSSMVYSTIYSQLNQLSDVKAEEYRQMSLVKAKYPSKSPTYEDMRASIVNLNIFYDRLGFTQVSEKESFTIVDLVSNIGGTFGLFIGISLLSLLELLEFGYEVFMLLRTNREKTFYIKD